MRSFPMLISMLVSVCRSVRPVAALTLLLTLLLSVSAAWSETRLSVLITSNLQGRSFPGIENQETEDPLLVMGQDVVFERDQGIDLYLDMGNALYPGILSKYSSGSIMMDFLDYFACDAVLVSSKDLQIGTKNLEFLQKDRKVRLLSSNIVKDGDPIFTPWFTVERGGARIAFLGLSSKKIRFDMAEKDLYGYNLVEEKEALAPLVKAIKKAGVQHIILLSGQGLKDTAAILESYPEIEMALCGGDYTGRFWTGKASRLDLADGRSIVMADDSVDYYRLELVIDTGIRVQALEPRKARPISTKNFGYQVFKNRLTLWKEKFREDEDRLVASLSDKEYRADDLHLAQLLRDRFDSEIGIVEEGTLNPLPVKQNVKHSDLLAMVNRDYNIFLFQMTGSELLTVRKENEELVIAGMEPDGELLIQGTPVAGARRYRVAATQPAMQKVQRLLGKHVDYSNTWKPVTDLLMEDLKNERIVMRSNFDYLDRRFRTTVDAYLSNFVENSGVRRGEDIETPPGQPADGYTKWGLENKIDITVYNKYHRFVFTPYMLYSRQDDEYLNNILRGTILYDYNLSETVKPYNKFRCDTVVEEVDGERPVLLRETLGVSNVHKHVSGKLGIGFEKEVQDPSRPALYGLELILNAQFPFLSHYTYTFDLDTFSGIRHENGSEWQIRSEIDNAITADFNAHLSISFRHKYFYYYEDVSKENYQNSQFITSLNLKNDWKFW
jgi:2',3'-cyclic-nucleotide 2'-phosphodiesterase (5'-nucleotidase family)